MVEFSLIGGSLGVPLPSVARPSTVFSPYLDRIRQTLPSGYEMRLPADILLGGSGDLDPASLIVNVQVVQPSSLSSELSVPSPQFTIELYTCEDRALTCWIGGFAATRADSIAAQQALAQHQQMDAPITLAEQVQGYLQDGRQLVPPSEFSSVMWEQDGMIYTVQFLAAERQNMLYMARSMAISSPIRSLHSADSP